MFLKKFVPILLAVFSSVTAALSQEPPLWGDWIGVGDAVFRDPSNWAGGKVPWNARMHGNSPAPSTIDIGPSFGFNTLSFPSSPYPTRYTIGAGDIGTQNLSILYSLSAAKGGAPVTINAKLILPTGSDGGNQSFRLGGPLIINGPIVVNTISWKFSSQVFFSGDPTFHTQINGEISGSGGVLAFFYGGAQFDISSQNKYRGVTTVEGATMNLLADHSFSSSTTLSLTNALIDTNGYDQEFGMLTNVASALIDFGNIANVVFSDSHTATWESILELQNFEIGTSSLRFGSSNTALTTDQLSKILLPGYNASLDDQGYVVFTTIPEPGTIALVTFSLAGLGLAARRNGRARPE
jgi:hypothetical protein